VLTLGSALEAHQQQPRRLPALSLTVSATRNGYLSLRPAQDVTGAETEVPHAAAFANSTFLQVRNDAGAIKTRQDFGAWSASLGAVAAGSPVALAAYAGQAIILCGDGAALKAWTSADDGASWSGPTTIVTEASAIGAVAAAYRPSTGNVCAFYVLGTTSTLKRLRRTSGTWAGSGTTWSKAASVNTITGLAASWRANDFRLILTGTAPTTLDPRVWAVSMGDGAIPANSWSGLIPIAEADASGGITFAAPFIAQAGITGFATFRQVETNGVPYDRFMLAHEVSDHLAPWREPVPLDGSSPYGLAAAYDGSANLRFSTTADSWLATDIGASHDLSNRLLALSWRQDPVSLRVRATLDNHDGAFDHALTAYPAIRPGHDMRILHGYRSGTAGAAEYGLALRCQLTRVTHQLQQGKATLELEAGGPWEQIASWRAPQAWTAPAATTRAAIFARLAARAGLDLTTSGQLPPSTAWTTDTPEFAVTAGESGKSALERLLAPTTDFLRGTDAFQICGLGPADTSEYSYGPGEHELAELALSDAPLPNWARVQGPDRYAEAYEAGEAAAFGPRMVFLRNLSATTDGLINASAAGALRRERLAQPRGQLTAPANVGQELYDVVTLTAPQLALTAQDYRVIGLGLEYRRGPAGARYDSILTLGEL
jgi:hypothetical protein